MNKREMIDACIALRNECMKYDDTCVGCPLDSFLSCPLNHLNDRDYVEFDFEQDCEPTRYFAPVKDAPADTKLPSRSTKNSAGYDFYAPEDILVLPQGCTELVWLNVKAYMQPNEYLQLIIRSSLAVKRNVVLETSGCIDSDYFSNPDNDGNIGVKFRNNGREPVTIAKGERCCQGVFMKYLITDDDDATGTRVGGYGSTGKN